MKGNLLRSPAAWLVALFLAAAALRLTDVPRPVARPDWREADMAGIARNFYREGMNPLYPRVDWRGGGPGFAEMELPILPWTMAALYPWTGVHEQVGRLLSLLVSLAALAFFFLLARRRLPPEGAVIAAALFAFNPLVVELATALKPDGLMLAASLAAVYAFLRWLDGEGQAGHGHRVAYWAALAATSLALLAKASAAHLGLLFGFALLARRGWAALRKPAFWGLALPLAPALLWYGHARRLWLRYGNSLGVSNESHWAGWDLFADPSFVRGIVRAEVGWVWTLWGLAAVALWLLVQRPFRRHRFELAWLASVVLFYLVTARTSADSWATYYHVLSVPPAALLVGAACVSLGRRPASRRWLIGGAVVLTAVGLGLGWLGAAELGAGEGAGGKLYLTVALVCGAGLLVVRALAWPGRGEEGHPHLVALLPVAAALALAGTLTAEARLLYWRAAAPAEHPLYACARSFATQVPAGALLVASGGPCRDPTGFPVAYNKSYMFYWMDRKGFNICREEQSLQAVGSTAARGAAYLVAEVADLEAKPGLEGRLRQRYDLLAECEQALLFRLGPPAASTSGAGGAPEVGEGRGHAER